MANSILSSLTDLFSAFASEEEKKQEAFKKAGGQIVPPMMTPEIPSTTVTSLGLEGTVPQVGKIPMPGAPAVDQADQFRGVPSQTVMPMPEKIPGSQVQSEPEMVSRLSDYTGQLSARQAGSIEGPHVITKIPKMGYQGVPTYLDPASGQAEKVVPPFDFGLDPTDIDSMRGMGTKPEVKTKKPRGVISINGETIMPYQPTVPAGGDEYGDIGYYTDTNPAPGTQPPPVRTLDSNDTPPAQPTDSGLTQKQDKLSLLLNDQKVNNVVEKIENPPEGVVGEDGKVDEESPWYKNLFSNIGNYLGDAFKTTLNDPVVKRALVSYLASRAVGTSASGAATFAGEVLQKGWEKDATLKAAAAKTKATQDAALAKDNAIDRTKIHTLFNESDNTQLNGYYSKNSNIFEPSDPVAFAKAYGIEPDADGNYPRQIPASSLTNLGLRPKTSEDLTRSDQINLVVDQVATETSNKLGYFKTNLATRFGEGTEEYNQALESHRKLLGNDGIRRALSAYQDRLPPNVDISDPRVSSAFTQAIVDFEDAIVSGRAVGNADLVGLIDQRFITYDLMSQQLPLEPIKVTDDTGNALSGDAGLVGLNAWSRTNNNLDKITSQVNQNLKGGKVSKVITYSAASRLFSDLPAEDKQYWFNQSVASADDSKDNAASPMMLWLNASMGNSSNNDRAIGGALTPKTLVDRILSI